MSDENQKNERTVFDALKDDYERGAFDVLKKDLEYFLVRNRDRIKAYYDSIERELHFCDVESSTKLELVIKKLILDSRILNPLHDAQDQTEEIRRHIWMEGVKLSAAPNQEVVAREWLEKYSKNWREYRLLAILYVFEMKRDYYVAIIDSVPPANAGT